MSNSDDKDQNLPVDNLGSFTSREKKLFLKTRLSGFKDMAPGIVASAYQLFLEGYSCQEISKQLQGFSEGDILIVRERHSWDENKNEYAANLQAQVQGKLIKTKLESVEFLTNQLAVIHKSNREKTLRYLMTGEESDLPEDFGKGLSMYSRLIDTLAKVTGEDSVKTIKTNITDSSGQSISTDVTTVGPMSQELQTNLLKKLVEEAKDVTNNKKGPR